MNGAHPTTRPHPPRHDIDIAAMPVRLAALLAALCAAPVFAVDPAWNVGGNAASPHRVPSSVHAPPARGSLTTFATLGAFQAATSTMAIVSEDFSARPAGNVSPCYEPVNHQLGQPGTQFSPPVCFDPGTLEPGFNLRSNVGYLNGFGTMAFGANTVGLPVPVVGAMSPATTMLIDFDHGPVAVAMDAWDWQAGSPLTFTVHDHQDAVIGSFNLVPGSPQQSVFAGFVSDVPVKRVTVAGAAAASQMISALHFGGRAGFMEPLAASADFGVVERGAIGSAVIQLRNGGDMTAALGSVAPLPPGSSFVVTDDGCSGATLQAGATCGIEVAFAPALRGIEALRWAVFPADDETAAVEVRLQGRASLPQLVADTLHVDFGDVASGGSATATVLLSSTGAVPVSVEAIGAVAAPFQLQGHDCGTLPATLAPGASCSLTLRFNAVTSMPAHGFVQIASTDPSSPLHVRMLGNDNDAIFGNGFESP